MFFQLVKLELFKLFNRRLVFVGIVLLSLSLIGLNGEKNYQKEFPIEMEKAKARNQGEMELVQKEMNRLENISMRTQNQEQELNRLQNALLRMQEFVPPKPPEINAFAFAIKWFGSSASSLTLPLLTILMTADLIAAEFALGTIRLILSSPIQRRRFLVAKFATGSIYVFFLVVMSKVIFFLLGGLAFGFQGGSQMVEGYSNLQGFSNSQFLLLDTALKLFHC